MAIIKVVLNAKNFKTKFPKNKKLFTLYCSLLAVLLPALLPLGPFSSAAAAAPPFANLKSIDVMKYTKDVIANQQSDSDIDSVVTALASMHVTDVAISVPMDSTTNFMAHGTQPYPRSVEDFTQRWADTIHQHGLQVIWRGTFSGLEGIYNFPQLVGTSRFPTGTATSAATDGQGTWLGKIYQYITQHPGYFADGDVWAPLPERTQGIFQDSTSFLPYDGAGIQSNYVNFFADLKTVSDQAFGQIGKNITTGYSANNYTEVMSGWLPATFFSTAGVTAIDYYGNTHTPQEMDSDLRTMAAMTGKPIFLQEWGDYWNTSLDPTTRTTYLQSIYSELQTLVSDGVLTGFNYWGGWDNDAEGLLTYQNGGFTPNYRGQLLSNFFASNSASAPTPPPTSPTPSPAICPAASSNAFTGCYYTDQNFGTLGLSRIDNQINFNWGTGSPAANIPSDHFSARWVGSFNFNPGSYNFKLTGDDGIRLYVDGQLLIDQWHDQAATTYTASKTLSSGSHLVEVDYYEDTGGAVAQLNWTGLTSSKTHVHH